MSKNSKFLVWKYIKVLEFKEKTKTFPNNGIKHKKYYMEGLNSKKKKIFKVADPLKLSLKFIIVWL